MKSDKVLLEKNGDRIQVPADAVDAHRKQGWWVVDETPLPKFENNIPEFDLENATVKAVLSAVQSGLISAKDALQYELDHKQRASLISKLKKIIEI